MVIKEREISARMRGLMGFSRRLSHTNPKYKRINEDYSLMEAGYKGEKSIEFPLNYLKGEHYILHDLRLFDGKHYFQIDTLVLTACYILIIEVKNYSGVLTFDRRFHQLIRMKDGVEEAFPDPTDQVERQVELLKKWIQEHVDQYIPIEGLVVFANERAVIKTYGHYDEMVLERVVRKNAMPRIINGFAEKYTRRFYETGDLKRTSLKLLHHHVELDSDLLKLYGVKKSDIISGVQCPRCQTIPMKRLPRRWYCQNCDTYCREAHHRTLKDYGYLISPLISNQEARNFLHISSRHAMKRILKAYPLNETGMLYKIR
ncbi:nuclease-related domain-containing protein [Halobacillus amylolyticus]|uniref:NERD domain-containing protein n=1 Tax=Halobacillus amylolyticus TaxID=2932259 RepID=A0ABY4HAT7_9BACI|nr:nuclease-related domain-containing protein [Halobacillus amylolyticus]UOR10520.1 NERD domain-containing protein [Halobacillus amylolyticus]